ncbi:hypothetical protein [Trueperella sp.]|uniref:hypothetical protein n=1 Tax=Trueperella sp. TaxID=2699835 RepID=UPI0022EB3F77|nr:hypothetical protein [Trueperella sp.]
MKLQRIFHLALRASRSQPVAAALIAFVVGMLCAGVLSTVGRSAAIEQRLLNEMESPPARVLTVRDKASQGFVNTQTMGAIVRLSAVESGVGVGLPRDVRNGRLAVDPIPIWEISDATTAADLVSGRYPNPGEAIVTSVALDGQRLAAPSGYLESAEGRQYPVVGVFEPKPGYERFVGGLVATDQNTFAEVHVLVRSIADAENAREEILGILGDPSTEAVTIDMPDGLDLHAQSLAGEVGQHNRTTLLIALGGGIVLISAVVLADVLLNRSDIGRRRALGISRADLTLLTILRTLIPAAGGAAIAALAVGAYFHHTHAPIPLTVTISVVILTLTATAASAFPPALWASRRDPVAVLRTP